MNLCSNSILQKMKQKNYFGKQLYECKLKLWTCVDNKTYLRLYLQKQ